MAFWEGSSTQLERKAGGEHRALAAGPPALCPFPQPSQDCAQSDPDNQEERDMHGPQFS